MTVHNPDSGEIFYDDERQTRLRFVGWNSKNQWVVEAIDLVGPDAMLFPVDGSYARAHLVEWTEKLVKLEQGQAWARSRNDYANRLAVILGMIEYGDTTYVIYEEINGNGPNPKMKREIDFRRVYGRLADDYRKKA